MVQSLNARLPLSSAQSEIWFAQQLDPYNPIFNTGEYTEIQGDIDLELLQKAIKQTISEVDSLHVCFEEDKDGIYQSLNAVTDPPIYYFDLSTEPNPHESALAWMSNNLKDVIDLKHGPLFSQAIFKIASNHFYWYQRIHHIVIDGFSFSLISKRVAQIYSALKLNTPYKKDIFEPLTSVIDEDQKYRLSDKYHQDKEFWVDYFDSEFEVVSLSDKPKKTYNHFLRNTEYLSSSEFNDLEESARSEGVNWSDVVIAITGAYLHRITGAKEIILGLPTMCRLGSKLLRAPGMVMNLLPLRISFEPNTSLLDISKQVSKEIKKVKRHQYYRPEQLRRDLNLSSSDTRLYGPIINVMPFDYNLKFDGCRGITHNLSAGPVDDISINVYYRSDGQDLRIDMDANPSIYAKDELINHLDRWMNYLKNATSHYFHQPISSIDILSSKERNQILNAFNDTKMDYSHTKTIHELFEEQVIKTPNQLAIVYEGKQLTYTELNEKANQFARTLRNNNVQPDQLIGIMVDRSIDMIVGILAILKAGGAYVPIDPNYPIKRINYILADSGVTLLITQCHLNKNYEFKGTVLHLDIENDYSSDYSNLVHSMGPHHLAYVIYTSGTTGKPKGVMVEHHGLCNLATYFEKKINISDQDRVLQFASFSFDAASWEIITTLLVGATLYIPEKSTILDYQLFLKYMNEKKITMALLPPTYVSNLDPIDLPFLNTLITGGSPTTTEIVKKWRKQVKYINAYGPTEDSVITTLWIEDGIFDDSTIPIGSPIANHNVYILNSDNQLQPIGIAGELCISGAGVARGYLNLPELTRQKFLDHPFSPGEKLYRTGDLAMWLPNGNIKYLGRIDDQVKIRGYRIELSEVESAVLSLDGISRTVITAVGNEESEKALCVYYVSDKPFKVSELKGMLSKQLPNYMIPSYFIEIEKVPLTSNGKIDHKSLPLPDVNIEKESSYVAPRTQIEEELVNVWQAVLGIKRIGILDNFYDLGGDSIKSIQVSARLLQSGYKVAIKDLLQSPTIAQLSSQVEVATSLADQGEVIGVSPLTPIQSYFFESSFVNLHFNQAMMLYQKECFDEESLNKVFTKIIHHHDALRTVFSKIENIYQPRVREIDEGPLFTLDRFNLVNEKEIEIEDIIENKANEIQRSMNIERGPLIKLGLFQTPTGNHLLIVIHHLIIDMVSWRILLEDLRTGYDQVQNGKNIEFPFKTDSFKRWSEKLDEFSNNDIMQEEKVYWNQIEEIPQRELPKDYENQVSLNKDSAIVVIECTKEETEQLLKQTNRAYNTEINDLLLTALGTSVHKWSGLEEILVNLEGHGRESIIPDIDVTRTIGWFTTQYPVLLPIKSGTNISSRIKTIKESLRAVPNKGIGYSILRYISRNDDGISYKLKPEISFNYLGQMDQDLEGNSFEISPYSIGKNMNEETKRLYTLNISGMVRQGNLSFEINYSKLQYTNETIQKLGNIMLEVLNDIIKHCINKTHTEITPSDLTLEGVTSEELVKIIDDTKHIGQIEDIYELTPMQNGMLFHSLLDKNKKAYFEQMSFDLKGDFKLDIFTKSLEKLIETHAILRTNIYQGWRNNPLQVVYTHRSCECLYKDISEKSKESQDIFLKSYLKSDKRKGFDLEKDRLLKVAIFKTGEKTHKVTLSFHHILMDGWCIPLILKELLEQYSTNLRDINRDAKQNFITPYSHFIEWLNKQDQKEAERYWLSYLEDYEEQSIIPNINLKSGQENYSLDTVICNLGEELTTRLQEIASLNQVTLNTAMQTIWGILLQKYNNSKDVVFGSVVSGRPEEISGIENMIGLFINTIPVRVRNDSDVTVEEQMKIVQGASITSKEYDTYPLYEIQALTEQKQNLINHIMVYQNNPVDQEIQKITSDDVNLQITNFVGEEQTNYDFNIKVIPGKELKVYFEYNKNLYDRINVKRIGKHLTNLIDQVVKNPKIYINDLNIITKEEEKQILEVFNNTKVDYSKDKNIHQLFEEQVKKTPNQIAVVYGEKQLTYSELNERANQLARTLRGKGVSADQSVAILTDRSLQMIVGILGILKSGGVYVPIDPDFPDERKNFMLNDCGTRILLLQNHIRKEVTFAGEIIDLYDEESYHEDGSNLDPITGPDNLAYVIYTSGTTGKPKGVMLEHHGLCNLQLYFSDTLQMNEKDRVAQFANLSFDASLWEVFSALFSGATLYVPSKSVVLDYALFEQFIIEKKITALSLTPAYAIYLDPNKLPTLKKVVTSGSSSSGDLVNKWKNNVLYINGYGPTENTICTSTWLSTNGYDNSLIPIGKPIQNHQIYIVDSNKKLQAIGVAGELCISGEGLARGYLNLPDLTREKFVENPFVLGEKMYRTGDLARWLPNGDVEFLGRIDHQVKIRGYRIELGEVEECLLSTEGIKESIVIIHEDENRNKSLCAYYVTEKAYTVSEIKAAISAKLPNFMIPSYFIQLSEMPLTHNGKINRKELPKPDVIDLGTQYVAPRTSIEIQLAHIWKKVLNLNKVGVTDNFFDLGGHSLKLLALVKSINEEVSTNLSIQQVLETPTIESLGLQLMNQNINLTNETKFIPLTQNKKINLFCFPTGLGLGITFIEMAKLLKEDCNVYTTDFMDQCSDYDIMVEKYVENILDIQDKGPYLLLGYCAGGNLAFEVTKLLEQKGKQVSDIIMLDTTLRNLEVNDMFKDKLPYIELANVALPEWAATPYAKNKYNKFKLYLEQLTNRGEVQANIHNLTVDTVTSAFKKQWANHTSKDYIEYEGIGTHDELLDSEFIHYNVSIIKQILLRISENSILMKM
ncbi:amino acid adenylation domain-containing protein [Peribacillus muralis]|uniref:amino acid adenylation domain-containing protein n=1 Tax=Peribacillus muralis TaxID=264697 RepID=UPI003D00645A